MALTILDLLSRTRAFASVILIVAVEIVLTNIIDHVCVTILHFYKNTVFLITIYRLYVFDGDIMWISFYQLAPSIIT